MTEDIRKLVTVETVSEIRPIPDADAIEVAVVRGWTVVVRKDEFQVGDDVVFFEIDSALPLSDERFAFLAPRGTKSLIAPNGAVGDYHVLKTARLRGTYSQGLILPLADVPDHESLDIFKYEPPLPDGANIAGPFPSHLARKTDSERVQNLAAVWDDILAAGPFIATEKVDGMSVTVARDLDGTLHVASRNWDLDQGGTYWQTVLKYGVDKLVGPGEALQAEIFGEGVQGNPLKKTEKYIMIFSFSRNKVVLPRDEWPTPASENAFFAPIYDLLLPQTPEEAIAQVDGIKSLVSGGQLLAEGVVWHQEDGTELDVLGNRPNFKVISAKYLLKHGG